MEFKLRDYQREAVDAGVDFFLGKSRTNALIVASTGCHAKGTMIPLATGGMKKVEDIQVGDRLIGDDGTNRTVLSLVRGTEELYKVIPVKGLPFVVNRNHILAIYKTREKNDPCLDKYKERYEEVSVYNWIESNSRYKHCRKLYKPKIVNFEKECNIRIDPYFMGVYIGDGGSAHGSVGITTQREEVKQYVYTIAEKFNLDVRVCVKNKGRNLAKTYYITSHSRSKGSNEIINILRGYNLYEELSVNKFIPDDYLYSSYENRLNLLAGLMDTDSYYDERRNSYEYCTGSKKLANQVEFLCRSLGLSAKIGKVKIVNGSEYYRMQINGDLNIIPTKVKIRNGRERIQKKNHRVTGFSIEPAGIGEYYGFNVDGNHLYCDDQLFVHHNCGKSLIIGKIAHELKSPVLVVQGSRELVLQNYGKAVSFGMTPTIYSASCNMKQLSECTYATIKSIKNIAQQFKDLGVKYVIVDEADMGIPAPRTPEELAKGSEFSRFMDELQPKKILGLTASPVKMQTYSPMAAQSYSQLNMLTRIQNKTFSKIIHVTQNQEMVKRGYWAELQYERWNFDGSTLLINSSGSEYTEESVKHAVQSNNINNLIYKRLMELKHERKHILVFMDSVENCHKLHEFLEKNNKATSVVVSGDMTNKARVDAVEGFKNGKYQIALNYGALGVGFDFPDLDCIVYGRPTFSLRVWYQAVGRIVRVGNKKNGLVVDCCGNYERFGPVEDLSVEDYAGYGWGMFSKDRLLTGIPMGTVKTKEQLIKDYGESQADRWQKLRAIKEEKVNNAKIASCGNYDPGEVEINNGMYKGKKIKELPLSYIKFVINSLPESKRNRHMVAYFQALNQT